MMSNISKAITLTLVCGLTHSLVAKPTTYWWTSTALSIRSTCPPALMYVSDNQGRITGTDINSPVDQYGHQKISLRLQNIPHSGAVETNIADDITDLPNPNTECDVNIMDGGVQSYLIHLVGTSNDFEQIIVDLNYHSSTMTALTESMFISTQNGVTKTVSLNCDPNSQEIRMALSVSPGDFLRDTQSACELGSISPPEACEVLEDLASEVEKAETKRNAKAEGATLQIYLTILNRLHNWGKDGFKEDWDDFKDRTECGPLFKRKWDGIKFFANDPAYSALELDVVTLLKALPK